MKRTYDVEKRVNHILFHLLNFQSYIHYFNLVETKRKVIFIYKDLFNNIRYPGRILLHIYLSFILDN